VAFWSLPPSRLCGGAGSVVRCAWAGVAWRRGRGWAWGVGQGWRWVGGRVRPWLWLAWALALALVARLATLHHVRYTYNYIAVCLCFWQYAILGTILDT
jgi:hypothetical protein